MEKSASLYYKGDKVLRAHCFSYRESTWELFMEEALFTEHSLVWPHSPAPLVAWLCPNKVEQAQSVAYKWVLRCGAHLNKVLFASLGPDVQHIERGVEIVLFKAEKYPLNTEYNSRGRHIWQLNHSRFSVVYYCRGFQFV